MPQLAIKLIHGRRKGPTRKVKTGNDVQEDLPIFILSDSAYANSNNRCLSAVRYKVEHTFGILKGCFRVLLRPNPFAMLRFESVPHLVLHSAHCTTF
ncbi:hypothetical protein PC115_g997 [Phytophthora cactorum]|uniref:DDE Tnp4 domain-containing protein n=1 Tax=Phytophthora cactorum TaxID=29920 RepID=A0A8T1DU99_9STRA|nr:hypothetical protein PC115_g997 [Phytophthora cactorum]